MNSDAIVTYQSIVDGKNRPRFKAVDIGARVAIAEKILERCELCAHQCEIDRTSGQVGLCHIADDMLVTSAQEHYGEEKFLVPSFTIFFASCTFECQFCQNWDISSREAVKDRAVWTPERLAAMIDENSSCKNVNFVGGEPTPHLPFILSTLEKTNANLPVVWNSNFYMSDKSMQLLSGVVDLYLSDFKFGNDDCAHKLAGIGHYFSVVANNHIKAMADSELLIRHLIMPNHLECCTRPILEFIARNLGDKAIVNLMDQYHPDYRAQNFSDINRKVEIKEIETVICWAKELKLNYMT